VSRWAPIAIAASAVPVHLALALGTDLSPDEAYYLCAARLGHRIVDHPPLTLWMLAASDRLAGLPVELRVRAWAVGGSFATSLALVALARRRGAGAEGCAMAAWASTWALLPMAGGFVTTPDTPFLLAVALALLVLEGSPVASGAALFVATLAKVTALPVGLLLGAARVMESRKARGALAALGPLLALPFVVPSLRFQVAHAFGPHGGWSPVDAAGAVAAAVLAQAALWTPSVVWMGLRGLRDARRTDQALVAAMTALVLLSALVRAVPPEPNWWAAAALALIPTFALAAEKLPVRGRCAIVSVLVLPTALAVAHTIRPFLPLAPGADPTARLHGWSTGAGHPLDAPGVGSYGPAAEDCVYRGACREIDSFFGGMDAQARSSR
jgi:hypothetical protein